MEDYVYILDYLPQGKPDLSRRRQEPVAYGLGEDQFALLELIPKPDVPLTIGERVYVGKDPVRRTKVSKIRGRVNYEELTSTAHVELPYIILDIVKANDSRFVRFYNEAPAISTRFHALELLPGLGKKTMLAIVDEQKKSLFASFADLEARVDALHSPEKLIAKRIELELAEPNQKYHLFTRPARQD
ncbi:MAG: DUF655 domain-containing protein [Thermoplasmata archaeon HGW-Thermoplasmata-1]|nr:MAG: DUF655 domain-containing protein [Thermoplasmata archaeon HGW-Thermoplasmata-1]